MHFEQGDLMDPIAKFYPHSNLIRVLIFWRTRDKPLLAKLMRPNNAGVQPPIH